MNMIKYPPGLLVKSNPLGSFIPKLQCVFPVSLLWHFVQVRIRRPEEYNKAADRLLLHLEALLGLVLDDQVAEHDIPWHILVGTPSRSFGLSQTRLLPILTEMSRLEAARPVQRSSTGRMAHPGRQDVTRWPQFCKNAGLDKSRRRGGGYNAQLLLTVVLFAVILTCSTAQELRRESTSLPTYIAGSQLWTRWGERGDVKHTVAQLGGIQQCSEGINARVDSEFLEDAMLGSCRQEAAGYDVVELLQPSEKLAVPSREQTTKLCRSEACTAWLSLAVNTSWLPECRYRQSQTSFRSLAETLLRIRDDLVATGVEGEVKAPNASLFREFYELNQLVNVLSENNDNPLNEISLPDMQVARRMSEEEGLRDQPITAAEHPESVSDITADNIRSLLHINGSSNPSDSANLDSTGNSSSIRDSSSDSKLDPSDDSDFTNRGVGTHASSTSTTTELTPSYAYVIGVWVLFNGSYFFLMRKKWPATVSTRSFCSS